MEQIIEAVDPETLEEELKFAKSVYFDESKNIEVYIFKAAECPNLHKEVARLREITFRFSGSGSGKKMDLDQFDTEAPSYFQIIVYNINQKSIIAGCRCYSSSLYDIKHKYDIQYFASSSIYDFSPKFMEEYFPYTMDVGRTFVIPDIQVKNQQNENLQIRSPIEYIWKGFGYLIRSYDIRYMLGRVVIYEEYESKVRKLLYKFLETHFADFDLAKPKKIIDNTQDMENPFSKNNPFLADYKVLDDIAHEEKSVISPLVRGYMKLSKTMKFFGSAFDPDLNDIEEMAVLLTINDFNNGIKRRFID